MRVNVIIICCLLALSGCASLTERQVTVSTAQMTQKLNQKLEKPVTVMKVFQLQLSNAQVALNTADQRIHTVMDLQLSSPLMAQTMSGRMGISGRVVYDAAASAVVLREPDVESLQLGDNASEQAEKLTQLARAFGNRALDGLMLYQVKPEDLSCAGRHFVPEQLQLTERGLQIYLAPAP